MDFDWTRCRHLRLNGARCKMPAIHGKDLCFDHDRRVHKFKFKPGIPDRVPLVPVVSFVQMEDHTSVLENLNGIAQSYARHLIDHREVSSLTYLMQTCLKTLRQMHDLETAIAKEDAPTSVEYRDLGYEDQQQPLAAPDPILVPLPPPRPAFELASATLSESTPPPPATAIPQRESASEPDPAVVMQACAEPSPSFDPPPFQQLAAEEPATPVFATLIQKRPATALFSNTCDLREGCTPPHWAAMPGPLTKNGISAPKNQVVSDECRCEGVLKGHGFSRAAKVPETTGF